MSEFYKLNDLQKMHYGSISYGGSDGNIVLNDTEGTNKWIGLRANTPGTLKLRMANGQARTIDVIAGEYIPFAVDTIYSTGSTAGIEVAGMCAWDEDILEAYI